MSDAALSVLVLAWDEAAPTLRTVVAAAPAVGSLLVLLPPQPPAPPTPTPPASSAAAPTLPETDAPAATPEASAVPAAAAEPAPQESKAAPLVNAAPAVTALPPLVPPRAPAPAEAPSANPPLPIPAPAAGQPATAAPAPQPAAPPVVRLLRLADNPLVLLEHAGPFRVPAAPYLGALPAAPSQAEPIAPAASATLPIPAAAPQEELVSPAGYASQASPTPTEPPAPLGPAEAARLAATAAPELSPAPVEAPSAATEDTDSELAVEAAPDASAEENVPALADAAFRAEEILDPDPMQELQAAPLHTPAATPADSPMLRDALPAAHGPFGLRIPERLPVLDDPASPPLRALAPAEDDPLPDEPAPAAPPYSAPDLNTQVIRYARQAVQAALAEGPFGTIYAPAWPTWLAALELRQRSGRPLVLHLSALLAGRQPADTAAGWSAEIQRQALRQADLVLVETYSLARRLRRELGLATNAVRVVPAGDTAAIARALRRARRA